MSPYRVVDATDHRGQLAGMVLAGLGAEVVLVEPPGGLPGRTAGDGLTWWAYNRGKHSVVCASADEVLELVRTADVLLDNGQFDRGRRWPRLNPAAGPRVGDGVRLRRSEGRLGGVRPHRAGGRVRPGAQRRRRPGPGAHRRCPRPGCTPAPRRRSARCSRLTERQRSGRGQHVDVSAQQAVMQAGIPGVLLAPNDNPEAQRTSGGILAGPLHLQFVYPASDGHVSITLLFGSMIGPFSRRLMEWVHEEGHCSAEMLAWDWDAFGLRLVTDRGGRRRSWRTSRRRSPR